MALPPDFLTAPLAAAVLLAAGAGLVAWRVVRRSARQAADLSALTAQLEEQARRLAFMAHHDALTGLPNRAMFEEGARQAVARARRRNATAALLFLDLDQFKQVNDGFGHEAGDALLREVAARLRASVRGGDLVARLGGDEFCVLLLDIEERGEAAQVAQKLLHEIAKPCEVGEHRIGVGASIGIACVPRDGDDVETLLRQADAAMYRAKEAGRNAYRFCAPRDESARDTLTEQLAAALERGELELAWQPRFDLASGRAVALEALLRWRHPERGVLGPPAFLSTAHDTGLIVPIGEWAIREACRQARRWRDAAGPLPVSLNVSARQLREPALPERVRAALADSGLSSDLLQLQVPESALRLASQPLLEALGALGAACGGLAVADFGTGYAALPLLHRLRVRALLLDRRLLAGVPQQAERADLVRALVALARSLGVDAVAKGIETPPQREFLAAAGCRLGQGKLFAAPGTAAEIEPLLGGAERRVA